MRGKHLKVFSSALLALVGVMAVSASSAFAEWELAGGTTNGKGNLELKLEAEGLGGEMLVSSLGMKINCTAGRAKATLETSNAMKTLTWSGTATFTECIMLEFADCKVRSIGQAVGTIVAIGSGTATMPAKPSTEVSSELSSNSFTELKFEDPTELCPFLEFTGGLVNGTAKLAMANPTASEATHSGTLDDVALKYGKENADLHATGELGKPITGTVKKEGGGNWGIKLIGTLP